MTIETKYNIGDEVWLIYDNQVKSATIITIGVFVERDMNSQYVGESVHYGLFNYHYPFIEDLLFRTKEELLKSL